MRVDWDGLDEFLEEIEFRAENMSLESFEKNLRHEFIILTYLLHANYRHCRNKSRQDLMIERTNRKRRSTESITGGKHIAKRSSSRMSQMDSDFEKDPENNKLNKINRESCVPDRIRNSKSPFVQAVMLMYQFHHIRPEQQNTLMLHLLSNRDADVESLKKLTDRPTLTNSDMQPYMSPNIRSVDKQVIGVLVYSMFVLSALLNDRVFSYRAGLMNLSHYLDVCIKFSASEGVTRITPYEYLIHVFLSECVPKKDKDTEKSKIHNQFKGSKKLLLKTLVESVRKALPSENQEKKIITKNTTSAKRLAIIDPDQKYEVFIGRLNYLNDLKIGYLEHGNRTYTVIFYTDCLYDVNNSFLTPKYNNGEIGDKQLYLDMPWSERLKLVDYRSKIELETCSGSKLMQLTTNATVTISWPGPDTYMLMESINLRTDNKSNLSNGSNIGR